MRDLALIGVSSYVILWSKCMKRDGGTVIYVKVSFFISGKNIHKINGTRYQNPFIMKRMFKLI